MIIVIFLHIIVCIALIMIVLLQTGKGADMGAAFGGGSSQTLFGSTGATTFLTKATTAAAIIFMFTCLTLAYVSSHKQADSVMKDMKAGKQTSQSQAASKAKGAIPAKPGAPVSKAPSRPVDRSVPLAPEPIHD